MGTTISLPDGDVIGTKLSLDSDTLPSSHEDGENGRSGRNSPAMIGKEVLASDNDLTERTNRTTESLFDPDKEIQVNFPKEDLMAYLQVVANHSKKLPISLRDDPDLDRKQSTLKATEYAKKSTAFIPSDVRVIGGSFLRYGSVSDLPNSADYSASDGAQEPGRSCGGANCNALLKVLYDSSTDTALSGQVDVGLSLFDDDEEESIASVPFCRTTTNGEYSLSPNLIKSSMSWSDLLRKMKDEIEDIEFNQVPTLSTSRELDLTKPFSIVPESFDRKTGKKRSLLIGCNYESLDQTQLKASHDDISSMKDYLVTVQGFSEDADSMTILLDDGEHQTPTFWNIIEGFRRLSEESQPGDVVFVQFSGHGGRVRGSSPADEAETYDEIIAPIDYEESGLIRDTLIFKTLIAPMRFGVTVTILIDSSDTGMMLDLPYAWSTMNDASRKLTKMEQNKDFSFVRFLKVIKTLYESSTFTQLGNIVDSAIVETKSQLQEPTDKEEVVLDFNPSSLEPPKQERELLMKDNVPELSKATKEQDDFHSKDWSNLQNIDESLMDRLVICFLGSSFIHGNTEEEFENEKKELSRRRSRHARRRSKRDTRRRKTRSHRR